MSRAHLFPGLALMSAVFALSCLGDQLVAPDGDLPPLLAVDRPAVQLFRFARGRGVAADTVRITNNGEGVLGLVERVGGVDYITTSRTGWLRTTIVNVGANEAFLVLEPTYAEEEQDEADVAEVVLKARGTPELKRVRVIARTLRGARFEFSVSPLTFAAVPGDPELTQSLTVRNGGNGTLRIRPPAVHHGGGVDGWLSLTNVKGGETAPEYQIEADPSGLGGGLYEAFLVFESLPTEETRARSDSVSVQLNIGQPALGLSTSSLSFTGIRGGAAPPPQNVALANSGEGGFTALGALQVGAVVYQPGAAGWLEVTQEGALVRAISSIAGLEKGEYEAAFVVTSENGGSGTLQIFLAIEAPVLTPSKSTVSFGLKEGDTLPPPPQRIPLSNTGAGTLASLGQISLGTPVPAVSWLTAGLVGSEVLLTPTGPSLALGAGDYSTQLPVHSVNGGSNTLSVTLSVARGRDPPKLTLSAADVEFRGVAGDPSPSPQDIQLTNAGGGTLGTISLGSVTYEGQGGWLSATLSATTVTLAATTGSLPAGSHRATVPVSSAQGGSAAIQVTLTLGSPVLTASSTSAAFSAQEGGGNPANQTITLSNTGPGTMASLGAISVGSVQYSGPGGWLSISPSGYTLTLSVTTGTLPTATYQATIPVNSARGGSVSVKVTFTVTRPPDVPDLVASPLTVRMDAVRAGADPADQDVLLSNGGGGSLGTLSVSGVAYAGAASGWLSASLVGSTVTLSASTGSLGPGTHTATVNLASANGGTESVAVTFVVRAPILTLSSGSVAFSGGVGGTASPASVTVNLSNTGAGDFASLGTVTLGSTSYGGTGGWLNASLGGGGTQVNLSATLGTLAAGSYTASVPVNSAVGGNASIGVSFTVAPSPADPVLSLSSTSAAFFSEEGGAIQAHRRSPCPTAGGRLTRPGCPESWNRELCGHIRMAHGLPDRPHRDAATLDGDPDRRELHGYGSGAERIRWRQDRGGVLFGERGCGSHRPGGVTEHRSIRRGGGWV